MTKGQQALNTVNQSLAKHPQEASNLLGHGWNHHRVKTRHMLRGTLPSSFSISWELRCLVKRKESCRSRQAHGEDLYGSKAIHTVHVLRKLALPHAFTAVIAHDLSVSIARIRELSLRVANTNGPAQLSDMFPRIHALFSQGLWECWPKPIAGPANRFHCAMAIIVPLLNGQKVSPLDDGGTPLGTRSLEAACAGVRHQKA